MQDLLKYVLLGRPVKEWCLAAACIIGGFIAGKVCSWILAAILKQGASKTKTRFDDLLIAGLRLPLVIGITLGGIHLGLHQLGMSPGVTLWTGRILVISLILVLALALNRILGAIIDHYAPASLQPVLRNFFKTLVWIIAAFLTLRLLGYNISALLAGLGLGGAALALASKDTLSNFFGSITVFVDKPFRLGDRIRIGSYDGVITEIGIRTARLRTLENRTVVIPNSLFAATPIENVSAAPNTRITQTLKVRGDCGGEKLEEALALLQDIRVPGLDGQPVAALAAVGGIVCQITFVFYITRGADYWGCVSAVNLEVLRRFKEAGIRLI
ncbi:mechanosensitive ion channel protein MscL [Spirochaetia bacterium]|nr:mechanosensitive ion channel protein MscL [Spirochaetia bacterium]